MSDEEKKAKEARARMTQDLASHASSKVRSALVSVLDICPDSEMRAHVSLLVLNSVLAYATAESAEHAYGKFGRKPPSDIPIEKAAQASTHLSNLIVWLASP